MNLLIHPAFCRTWQTANAQDCNCIRPMSTPWRIRKEPAEQFPWRVWRHTNDGAYEPLMRCSSFAGAIELVDQLQYLRMNVIRKDSHA